MIGKFKKIIIIAATGIFSLLANIHPVPPDQQRLNWFERFFFGASTAQADTPTPFIFRGIFGQFFGGGGGYNDGSGEVAGAEGDGASAEGSAGPECDGGCCAEGSCGCAEGSAEGGGGGGAEGAEGSSCD